ncbi:hypothetical protein BaRGS_00026414 [Batillaria attramentaria]|uniref:Peptidase S1 domain-containing protein n=1 Tax=Batillaria attramentaria TaxID=370345 RepID=A0ABD0K4M8_9CAEN
MPALDACFVILLACLINVTSQVTLPTSCGRPAGSPNSVAENARGWVGRRVVGGEPTTTVEFPWTALLMSVATTTPVCGGAILASDVVLTAAHCFTGLAPNEVYLRAGRDSVYSIGQYQTGIINIKTLVIHEGFRQSTYENDIAIIQLNKHIAFSDGIKPVCFPNASHSMPPGTICELAGYGDTLGTGTENRLNKIKVPIVDDHSCTDWLSPDYKPAVSICAGYQDGGPDTCSVCQAGEVAVGIHGCQAFTPTFFSTWTGSGERLRHFLNHFHTTLLLYKWKIRSNNNFKATRQNMIYYA